MSWHSRPLAPGELFWIWIGWVALVLVVVFLSRTYNW